MVKPVIHILKSAILPAVLLLSMAAPLSLAQQLVDPTRPPASLGTVHESGAASSGPVLQSVMIRSGQSEAIISGQTVKPGDKFGDARVVKITESEVVLRSGKDVQTLKLFPDVEKRPTASRGSAKPGRRGEQR